MESWNSPFHDKKKELEKVINNFLNTSSVSDVRIILEQNPELLSERVYSTLDSLLKSVQSKETIDAIQTHIDLLGLCREIGIPQAFEKISSSSNNTSTEDLQIILTEIDKLSRPQDMPRKIMMLQHALSLVQCQSNPEHWAILHRELGNSLYQNPQGNRSDNLEQAIEHYNQALEVYTHDDFPVDWAEIQNNLMAAYSDRIKGDRVENIEQALKHCNKALEVYTQKNFPIDWAMIQNNLAAVYINHIQGDRAENIEKAIEHYNQALEVQAQQDFLEDWAMTQNNLANAYWRRIREDRAENIEKAIEHYNQALKVYSQSDYQVEWAMIQNNLANAYSDHILENHAENIEKAIKHYNHALEVRTHKDFPIDWAETQNNLGLVYFERIRGDRAENIEKAIEHCNQALEVYIQRDFSIDWAMIQNNLGNAYWSRIQGDRAENIEKAIEYFNQALQVRKQKNFPIDWATTQNNLGIAYSDRIRGDSAENIETAIKHFNRALKVRTKKSLPVDWAMTQNNLAAAYWCRIKGNTANNIERAIEHYNLAFEVYTHHGFPNEWAKIQNNLGSAYSSRIRAEKAENIEQAIEFYNHALDVYTYYDFPVDWATTQNNLASAYCDRIMGNKAENIEKAINHYHNALEVFKLGSMPRDFRKTHRLLGDLYLNISQWEDAIESYKNAIKASNFLYRSGLSSESKSSEVRESAYIYQNASFAAFHMNLAKEALLFLEGGKTRLLREALRLKMKLPEGIPKDKWIKYEEAAEKYHIAVKSSSSQEDYAQREKEVQQALEELDASIKVIREYNPEFQKELDISDILSIPNEETALLAFCITGKGSIGFAVSGLSNIKSVDLPGFKTEDLNNLLFKTDEQGYIASGWIGDYLNHLNLLVTKSNRNGLHTWQKTFNSVLSNIGSNLLSPLLAELPPQIKKLILLPSGGLILLPLHAVPLSNGKLLCQNYCVSYAPSIPLFREMKSKARSVKGKGIYEVINPQGDPSLVFSGCEGRAISELFQNPQVNVGETGTKATVLHNIPGKAYIHFSCHGSYNWNDPPQSGLNLFGGRTLSLADLQDDIVDMSSARLVTISACETGIADIIKDSADEFIGLPAGFMLAGVPCVVSSLWSVPEISTALLMERFYFNHIKKGMDIPQALQDAQLWVLDLKSAQVADYVEKCYQSGKWEGKSKEFIEQYKERYLKLAEESPNEKPFQHPYYWAAFTVNGA